MRPHHEAELRAIVLAGLTEERVEQLFYKLYEQDVVLDENAGERILSNLLTQVPEARAGRAPVRLLLVAVAVACLAVALLWFQREDASPSNLTGEPRRSLPETTPEKTGVPPPVKNLLGPKKGDADRTARRTEAVGDRPPNPALPHVQVARITGVIGRVKIGGDIAAIGTSVFAGASIETGDADRAQLTLKDGSILILDFNTRLSIENTRPARIKLTQGNVWANVSKQGVAQRFEIDTTNARAIALGTQFRLEHEEKTVLSVREGTVEFVNPQGSVVVGEMFSSTAAFGEQPTEPVRLASIKEIRVGNSLTFSEGTARLSEQDARFRLAGNIGYIGATLASGPNGIFISAVGPDTRAYFAGIKVGDVVRLVDGEPIESLTALNRFIVKSFGRRIDLTVDRAGRTIPISVVPGPSVPAETGATNELVILTLASIQEGASKAPIEARSTFDTDGATHNNLGVLHEMRDEMGPAIRSYQTAIARSPRQWLYHYNLGIALRKIGNLRRSAEELHAAVWLAPPYVRTYFELSQTLITAGEYAAALQAVDQGLQRLPRASGLWRQRSAIVIRQGDLEAAREAVDRSLQVEPDSSNAWNMLGVLSLDLGRNEDAVRALSKAIELSPQNPDPYLNLGSALARLNRLDEAESAYRKAVDLDPDAPDTHVNLGNIYRERGKVSEAEAEYRRAIEIAPSLAGATLNLSQLLIQQDRMDEAERLLLKALEAAPSYPDFYFELGLLYERTAGDERALAMYEQAIALQPSWAEALTNKGNVLTRLRRSGDAEDAYRKAIALKPKLVQPYVGLGSLLREMNRWEEAETLQRELHAFSPDRWTGNTLAFILAERRHKLDEALQLARAAAAAGPEEPFILYTLGYVHLRRNEAEKATEALQRAVDLVGSGEPAFADIWLKLALAHESRGNRTKALDAFDIVLKLSPGNKEALAGKERLRR